MNGSVPPIGTVQLLTTIVLVLVAGGVSALLRLGLLRSLAWGTVRTVVQLLLIGHALLFIFSIDSVWLVLATVALMSLVAAHAARARTPHVAGGALAITYLALFASTLVVSITVCALIVRAEPWYAARIAIPISGMILGNAMNGIALALDRLASETRSRAREIESLLLLGASPWEAIRDPLRESLRAGMIPTINSLKTVGLVSLPGMMTGQILGGVDPLVAVRYQIVVMLMLAAAVAMGSLMLLGLYYRRLFTDDEALDPALLEQPRR